MTREIPPLDMNAEPKLGMQARSDQPAFSDDPLHQAPERWGSYWWLLLVGLIAAVLCLPFFRVTYLGDEGIYLYGAERMIRGSRLYADFFEFLPPGGFVLAEVWFSIVGISFESARVLAILTIVGIACFTFLACRQASKDAPLSALLTTVWVIVSQGLMTQVSHHWFTTLFSMIAASAALASVETSERWLRWPLIAGTAASAAAMINPSRGALAMIAGVTPFLNLRRHRAELIIYVFGGAVVPIGLLAYVLSQHAFTAAFDDIIRFTAERYAPINVTKFGRGASFQNLPLLFLFPLAALLTLLMCARDWRGCLHDRLLRLCAAFGLAGFVGCFPRPDMAHIIVGSPLSLPLLAYCITQLTQRWRQSYRYMRAAIIILLCAPSAGAFSLMIQRVLSIEAVLTPRGRVAFFGRVSSAMPALLARIAATPAGDIYFFYPYIPMLPFLTAREHAAKYLIFTPEYTLPSQYQDACLSVMRHASWVVIDHYMTNPDTLKSIWPAMQNTRPPETRRFEQALDNAFEFVAQEGTFELRRRRDGVTETLCRALSGL